MLLAASEWSFSATLTPVCGLKRAIFDAMKKTGLPTEPARLFGF
jgi:hypothetical protein